MHLLSDRDLQKLITFTRKVSKSMFLFFGKSRETLVGWYAIFYYNWCVTKVEFVMSLCDNEIIFWMDCCQGELLDVLLNESCTLLRTKLKIFDAGSASEEQSFKTLPKLSIIEIFYRLTVEGGGGTIFLGNAASYNTDECNFFIASEMPNIYLLSLFFRKSSIFQKSLEKTFFWRIIFFRGRCIFWQK